MSGKDGGEPERGRTPFECTPELTALETAVVKMLPKWPEALKAVFEYAETLARVSLRPLPGQYDEEEGGPDGLRNPI